jgi:hypothetical protein
MAITYVETKDGKKYSGEIKLWRPMFNYFTIYSESRKFSFDECEKVYSTNERVNINSCRDGKDGEFIDRMLDAHKSLNDGRAYKWTETDEEGREHNYPSDHFAWESKYVTAKPNKRKTK